MSENDDYRFAIRAPTRAEAVRQLLKIVKPHNRQESVPAKPVQAACEDRKRNQRHWWKGAARRSTRRYGRKRR